MKIVEQATLDIKGKHVEICVSLPADDPEKTSRKQLQDIRRAS